MGGHGAWEMATHYPDRAYCVAAAAGWISKVFFNTVPLSQQTDSSGMTGTLGDSNRLWEHDIQSRYADPFLKAIFESTVTQNDVDILAENLKGIKILLP